MESCDNSNDLVAAEATYHNSCCTNFQFNHEKRLYIDRDPIMLALYDDLSQNS